MSINYAPRLPKDKDNEVNQQCPPAKKVLATTVSENATVSSAITLNDGTTAIEVTTVAAPAFIRWVPNTEGAAAPATSVFSAVTVGNFDHVIPVNSTRRFVVPVFQAGVGNTSSVVGANVQAGLYKKVAIKTAGIASVMTTEF